MMHSNHADGREVAEIRRVLSKLNEEATPRTMPPAYYVSEDFLALEQATLFTREWACVGHAGEIPESGDFFATEIAGEPILVVRDNDGQVAVLSNVCRHRGTLLVEGSGRSKRFVCPYHAWTYGLKGELIAAPLMDKIAGFDKKACSLHRFRHELWNGFIYVNISGDAEPLAPRLSALDKIIENYQLPSRNLVHVEEDIWAVNWKCLAENFMEGYHLTPTHAKTLHPITPTNLCRKMPNGEYFTGYFAGYNPNFPDRKPYPDTLTEQERRQSPLFWIAPNHVVGLATNNCVYMCLRPNGVDHVAIRWGVLSTAKRADQVAKDYVDLCNAFNAEDKAKLELLQRGLKSRFLKRGFLAPDDLEGAIWDIYRFVARRLGSDVTIV